jgi:hypothetical protein
MPEPRRDNSPLCRAGWLFGAVIAAAIVMVAATAWGQDAPSLLDAPPQADAVAPEQRTGILLRTVVGLLALMTLAYLGGHRRVRQLEERLGLSQAVTAGLPFVVLGAVSRHPSVGVLTNSVLADLGPLLRFALGWLGFLAGFRFDFGVAGERTKRTVRISHDTFEQSHGGLERLSSLPLRLRAPETRSMFTLTTGRAAIAFVVTGAAMALALFALAGFRVEILYNPAFYRDVSLLGIAGALASGTPRPHAQDAPDARARSMVLRRVQDIVGVVGLLLVAAYFRSNDGVTFWQLPGTAWLLLALGLGTAIGFVAYAVLTRARNADAEAMVLLIGTVAFGSGMAGYLRLSPLVVCFLAGLIVANLPGGRQRTTLAVLERVERPIYLLFLVVTGALLAIPSVAGWLLMIAFVVMRLLGQSIGIAWARRNGEDQADTGSVLESPMGALSIAVVVSAQVLFSGGVLPLLTSSVLGGVLIGEVLSQIASRVRGRGPPPSQSAAAPRPAASKAPPARGAS